jgi:hypothetical protein
MSRPLSVNQSSRVSGCQAKPTVFRMPRANVSKAEPSGFIRWIAPYMGSGWQMLHGAPTGT